MKFLIKLHLNLMHMLSGIRFYNLLIYSGFFLTLIACKKEEKITPIDDPIDNTGVSVNLSLVPYAKLSEYRFFDGAMMNQTPTENVVEYAPASSLFTDYALKKRFIWMPKGVKAEYVSDQELLNFPVGTALIKNFYYDNMLPNGGTKIIETRVMIKKSTGWIFAEYVWNEAQNEAFLEMNGSYQQISWLQDGDTKSTNYRIPSDVECLICHKTNSNAIPIGLKPQNINVNFEYQEGVVNQLQKLIQVGYLQDNLPTSILTTVNYSDPMQPLDLRLRSYLDMNCAHCHKEDSHCDYRPLRLAFSETSDPVNIGLCVEPDEFIDAALINIVAPSNINRSVMHFRLNSTDENTRMPLLGRTLVHQEGVQLLEDWINSKTNCD
jgi:uncharacterized repeat protein (TIGR03806 family)